MNDKPDSTVATYRAPCAAAQMYGCPHEKISPQGRCVDCGAWIRTN